MNEDLILFDQSQVTGYSKRDKKMTEQKVDMMEVINGWNERFKKSEPAQVLDFFCRRYPKRLAFSTSLGAEDQVVMDMLSKTKIPVKVFTLDTGRLFPETYDIIDKTSQHYGNPIEIFFPDRENIENMVKSKGVNLFYESPENRKLCCYYRKIEPLSRALAGMDAWITGIRKDQTLSRFETKLVEWDEGNGLIKINPLFNWTEKMVWDYIRQYNVPYNSLHDKGFPSIGCQPCTRAVKPGDDPRSGRWWWEDQGPKECGLHVKEG
jgi:phosphoadenosine phosphosulfate reductase